MQLENLQLVVNVATAAVNTRGPFINAQLHDILAHVQEITLHDIHHGASVALATAQVQTGYELHTMETGFPMGDGPEEHEELIKDLVDVAEAIVDITSAQDVINNVFD